MNDLLAGFKEAWCIAKWPLLFLSMSYGLFGLAILAYWLLQ